MKAKRSAKPAAPVPVSSPKKRGVGNGAKDKAKRPASVATRAHAISSLPVGPGELGAIEMGAAAEWVDPASLVLWAKNPKAPSRDEVEGVARSIIRFGFGAALVARLADREVIAGHTRLAAVRMLPGMYGKSGDVPSKWSRDAVAIAKGGPVPCRFLDLSEDDAHLLALADNELGADWEPEALLDMLKQLREEERLLAGWHW